jgi:hypothetical protein
MCGLNENPSTLGPSSLGLCLVFSSSIVDEVSFGLVFFFKANDKSPKAVGYLMLSNDILQLIFIIKHLQNTI